MKKKNLLILGAIVVVLAAVIFFVTSRGGSDTLKIGTIMSVSGPVSHFGTQCRDAIQLAVDEFNARGGVLGKQVQLIVEDDEKNPEKTMNALVKLATKDKVKVVIGALTSDCTLAITQEAQRRGILLFTPTSTNDSVTDAGDLIFRSCFKDSFQGQVMAHFAVENLNATKAAVLYDMNNDYSTGLMKSFEETFASLGGTVVASESYAGGDKDFNAQLTKIKAADPDVLFLPDYYNTVSLIINQARNQGLDAIMLGPDGWDELVGQAGEEAIGGYFCNHYSPDADDADVKEFVRKYRDRYGVTPNALAALGYDAAYIVLEAIERAGTDDPQVLKKALMETDKKYVTGRITFDEKHNPVKSTTILKVVKGADGKLATEYVGMVDPE
ncbi:MAG TPA: ABC transporter substrate-binding protein [Firmicutes bacterium]|uniref:ABC transporter substrate-binding protein n=1 Tax=Capillibacterium thermochitinicola TaxID=2699427 RepID=A0A8J6I1V9_9FIRM|nr:ABC transporter substrate-binding protein [Capillibacterium thermochitinicola]MBA2133463.1 ABC transporter substrate-binding protein [Capillibacterium thermochitinicola]HHW11504.1 ABC transporter substrate-binding protein [Bacillota bacterium]